MPLSRPLLLAPLLLLPQAASAHEAQTHHGGRVVDVGAYHVELASAGGTVDAYLTDGAGKPVPATGFRGVAILVVAGQPVRVPLEPAEGSRLSGRSSADLGPAPRGAIRLTAPGGATATGRLD